MTSRLPPSLTLTLLQAREAAMAFFRPLLNQNGLTEQQWRVIRVLAEHGQMESQQLAERTCILKPSMTGVLARLERDGLVRRHKPVNDLRRVHVCLSDEGQQRFDAMQASVAENYRRIEQKFGTQNMRQLLALLDEFRKIKT